jgi:hypothetical protein
MLTSNFIFFVDLYPIIHFPQRLVFLNFFFYESEDKQPIKRVSLVGFGSAVVV